jgi:DNA-binding GntR family transcriptional regulator
LIESLESRAYQIMRNDIISAKLTSGMLLSENEISVNLGISRTPVHSAIVQLVKDGLLESLPKRGFIVKDISVTAFLDMHESIVSMEYYSLALIKDNNPINMCELKRHLDSQTTALETGDNFAYYEAGFEFATIIIMSTGNKVMLEVLKQFRDKMLCKILNHRKTHPDHKPNLARNRNEKIYEALANDHVADAQAELLKTMIKIRDYLFSV